MMSLFPSVSIMLEAGRYPMLSVPHQYPGPPLSERAGDGWIAGLEIDRPPK